MKKEHLLLQAKADHDFVTKNVYKQERERWVLERWLEAQNLRPREIRLGEDPPDFVIDGKGVEIVEAMEAGRRRGDEYKQKVADLERDVFKPRRLSLSKVQENGHAWILNQVKGKIAKGYDVTVANSWILLVYANFFWADKLQWELLRAKLLELEPPFARVDVVHSVGGQHDFRTVFELLGRHAR